MREKRIQSIFALTLLSIVIILSGCKNKGLLKDDYFHLIKTKKVQSSPSVEWKNFGPGMSGYCEEFWCHPTDTNVMFMGPDMHVSYGTWDNGKSWQTIKDPDGLGQDMKRVLDIEFSLQDPDFGMALDWNGWIYETYDRGRSWTIAGEFGETFTDIGIDPSDPGSFEKGWYYEQRGTRHSELAVDPKNDSVWYVGAGDFWNVKNNHRTAAQPDGVKFKYAAYGYIWKTNDRGKSWTKITNGLSGGTEVGKIIVDPNHTDRIVMATNEGLMLSNDGGLSWTSKPEGLPNNMPRDLTSFYDETIGEFILYLVEQTVYEVLDNTVSSKGGVYKSMDGGQSWIDISGNLRFDLNAINSIAEVGRYYRTIASWFGISIREARERFNRLPSEVLPVYNRIAVNPVDKNEIYVTYNKKHDYTFGPGDVWRTLNGGTSWITTVRHGAYWLSDSDLEYWETRNNPTGANIEFAHLQPFMDRSFERSGNRFLVLNSIGEIFIQVDQQTLKSTDKGQSWIQVDDFETSPGSNKWIGRGGSDLPGRFMLHETGIHSRRLFCCGEHGLWQTTDLDGWSDNQAVALEQIEGQIHEGGAVSISTVAVHPRDPDIIYLLSWRQENRGKVRRSTDGGKSWENIATIFDADNASWRSVAAQNSLTIDPVNPENMYFCATYQRISEVGGGTGPRLTKGEYGFYRSMDGGYTWVACNRGFHEGASVRRILLDPADPGILYAALNDNHGGLYRSTNKGSSWKRVQIPEIIKAVNNVFIDRNNHNIYICTGRSRGSYEEGGVWCSKDNGSTWQQIFKAPFVWQAESSPVNPDMIVISVAGQSVSLADKFMNPGIYLTRDGGENWVKINRGLGQPDKIVDLKPDPYNEDVLWCSSWGCGWFIAYLNDSKEPWLKKETTY